MLSAVPAMPIRDNPDAALIVYTVLMVAITTGFLVWWLNSPRERRIGPALPILLVGGALSGLMESWLDNVVLVGYPPDQNLPVLESFGRSVPIFVPIGYAWFCGGLLYLMARRVMVRGITTRDVWTIYGIVVVVDFVAIGLSHWLGVLEFFGDPPMKVLGYPIWWAGIDGLHVILGGSIVILALHHLRGRAQAWLVLVPSVALGASAGIVGWPVSTAINTAEWSDLAKYLCAFASIGLSLACVTVIARLLPRAVRISRGLAAPGAPAAGEPGTTPVEDDRPLAVSGAGR
jgi:hypothetical protein